MEQVLDDPRSGTPTLEHCPQMSSEELRRRELADFLRARRKALSPMETGLPDTKRRRVRGLRREEVAEMAGISTAWYTWIEQSRTLNLSQPALDGISMALRLDHREREHLYLLAGHPLPLPQIEDCEQVMDSLQQVVQNMDPNPAYVLDTNWDILAWNKGAKVLFGDFGEGPESRRNFLRLMFTDPVFRQLYVDWESVAHCMMAHFRSDSVGHVGDIRWLHLIDDLNRLSPEFHVWWPNHRVTWPMRWQKILKHPTEGVKTYNTFDLEIFRPARLRIVTYIPSSNPNAGWTTSAASVRNRR